MEGDEAVLELVFLEQRTKSKHSACLVASGPAGKFIALLPQTVYERYLSRLHTLLEHLQSFKANGLFSSC